ncbi:sigma-E factor negative regulatory protein [Congregibacter variabilis]|uniref:Sigma-E factor negative regulatory protein n=1 Tax=Congregibacter variabilis TaxID=3081200 RepID=A0ABZ0I354_9GAMM|nr:sigma-E factor negative regulatory protein [Congregibacter sp. IMCC43200]
MRNAQSIGPGATPEETLSALADNEAQELELRRVLRELDGAPELRDHWYRLHAARAVMHGETVRPSSGFAVSVRAAIDAEPALRQSNAGNLRRALGSFAVAASVAAVVVLGGQQLAVTSAGGGADLVARVAPLPVGVVNTAGAVPVQASFGTRALPTLQPADRTAYRELARQRLRRYSQEHAEHASLNTPQGMLPFARVPVIEQ